jgi:GT2 family glycosyltransferase
LARTCSVIVATKDRPDHAARVVEQALGQAPEGCDVWVVDQSEAGLRARLLAALDPRARLLCLPPVGLPAARNAGLAASSGEIVVFFDDDVLLDPGCVQGHLDAYEDPWVGGVVGRIDERVVRPNSRRTRNDLGWSGRVRTNLTGRVGGEVGSCKGANMSFRRVALTSAGPADEGYGGTAFLEDADWSTRVRRLGWRLRFEPRASLTHLSAPAGGCRVEGPLDAEWWRFRNTGYFMRRHRAGWAWVPLLAFTGLAARRGLEARSVGRGRDLVAAWVLGWTEAGRPRG